MSIHMADKDQFYTIRHVGGNEDVRRFLANLGFVKGAQVMLMSSLGDNVILNIKGSRIAVNADMARHIMI